MSEEIKIRYFLGIDAGGTKTEFLLTDKYGNEIKRAFLGAANPVNCGIEKTKETLRNGIFQVCENINYGEVAVFAGLAGGISADNKNLIHEFMSEFGFGAYDNGSDTDNALEIALKGEDGVTVIMGTGIVAFSQYNGVRHRAGGWGYLIDKGGSGFRFGADALECAFRAYDGRCESRVIYNLVEKKLGKPLPDCITDIYGQGINFVASFAPVVFEAFEMNDEEAEKIIDSNAGKIAELIIACCKNIETENKKIVLCGGMCRRQDILEKYILKHLGAGYSPVFTDEPMVNGAVSLAMKIGG